MVEIFIHRQGPSRAVADSRLSEHLRRAVSREYRQIRAKLSRRAFDRLHSSSGRFGDRAFSRCLIGAKIIARFNRTSLPFSSRIRGKPLRKGNEAKDASDAFAGSLLRRANNAFNRTGSLCADAIVPREGERTRRRLERGLKSEDGGATPRSSPWRPYYESNTDLVR